MPILNCSRQNEKTKPATIEGTINRSPVTPKTNTKGRWRIKKQSPNSLTVKSLSWILENNSIVSI